MTGLLAIQSIFKSFNFTVDEEKPELYKMVQFQILKVLILENFFSLKKNRFADYHLRLNHYGELTQIPNQSA